MSHGLEIPTESLKKNRPRNKFGVTYYGNDVSRFESV